ncbi:SM-20-related protein [Psychrobacter sp. PL15]|uniref:2OG-Fe(II) oxygenase n=1 Tax=unclassified Psychrobacter TaxID=196806 RepID=UPI001AE58269|nr:2OG-Fe(II) oxygenase [Psychrobacter sp. PL15]MEC5210997.1 SM-20-related protein [Psychrobacter sp. PL15]
MIEISSNLHLTDLSSTELVIDNPIGDNNPPLLTPNIDGINDVSLTQHELQLSDFEVDWGDRLTNTQLDKLVNEGWIIIDDVFNSKALLALQAESGFVDYRAAQLTAGIQVSDIRGDNIRWITQVFFAGFYYLQSINALATVFNRSLFTGIRHSEAHYACYPVGFGYQWHKDNPTNRDERVLSAVFYLNDEWANSDGGALEVIDNHGKHHNVMPVANRLVIFNSNIQHQVQTAHRQRYSIATWMRRDGLVPFVENT